MVVASAATRMGEVPELGIVFSERQKVSIECQWKAENGTAGICVYLRKLPSRWDSPARAVSRAQTASACWAEQQGVHRPSLSWQEHTAILGTGGPCLPVPIRVTAETADGGGLRWGWGTRQPQQIAENPLGVSWTQQVCWGQPFLLEDETRLWFFPDVPWGMSAGRAGAL